MTIDHHDDNRSYERLLADLRTGNPFVRIEAAEALGRLGDLRAFDALIRSGA
jgi:HEAT repeat protein